jgi:fibronectin-binding autotransporter adhesin
MANSFSLAFGGTISGTGSLRKIGTGIQTLNGANSYVGGSTISGGIVQLGSATALGTGIISVATGGEIDLNGQTIANNFGTVAGNGPLGNGAVVNNSGTPAAAAALLLVPHRCLCCWYANVGRWSLMWAATSG